MAESLKIALFGLHWYEDTDPEAIARQAQRAEAAGFEALWVGDHIALPEEGDDEPRLEALIALTYLAAVTQQIRLGIGVIVLPQRQPVLLAKQLTSIDILSHGRLSVGIGVGHIAAEMEALGASFAERGARTNEYLAAMRTLWRESASSFAGQFVAFDGVVEHPQPVQRPNPPIIIGGHAPSSYRRAIQSGNGWYGWELDLAETAQALAQLREAATRYPRPPELGPLDISITPRGMIDLETARRYAELGVHRLVFLPAAMTAAAIDETIARVAETLIGHF
ncbi:MAG TPA: TIGR03619 family F420-dependent LLM class oxidoreductase [Ktedonobacterales bacterium]|nr:TIGR03619 family F420-dependent LLM class oxidoreductase [Ktedonobacterales bacterium]